MLNQLPQIAMKLEHPDYPQIKVVQVTADSQRVTIAYYNALGIVVKAHEVSVKENPELNDLVKYTYFGDVWDMEILEPLVDLNSDDEQAPELAPLIPAYLQSLAEAS